MVATPSEPEKEHPSPLSDCEKMCLHVLQSTGDPLRGADSAHVLTPDRAAF